MKKDLKNIKVEITKYPTESDWIACKERALVTMGKKIVNAPDFTWKQKMLTARHSPIRCLNFSFTLTLPYWLACELRTHKHAECYIKSQRDDRNVDPTPRSEKPQGAMVNMIWDMNAESLMVICEKRLCGCATVEAQYVMKKIKELVLENCPEFGGLLFSFCDKYNICNEIYPCGRLKENRGV